MRKIRLIALGLLFINALIVATAHAQPKLNPLHRVYLDTYGRTATSEELGRWQKSGAPLKQIADALESALEQPEGAEELHGVLNRVYEFNLGREPAASEFVKWQAVIKDPTRRQAQKPNSPDFVTYNCYKALTNYFGQWLKTDAADTERKILVNRSYFEVSGRVASVEELN